MAFGFRNMATAVKNTIIIIIITIIKIKIRLQSELLLKMHWVLWAPYYLFSFIKFDKFCNTFLSSLRFHSYQKKPQQTAQHYRLAPRGEASGMERRWRRVTLYVHTCSGRNRTVPLMLRPNTDSKPNTPVTWQRNQFLMRYAVHTVTIRC